MKSILYRVTPLLVIISLVVSFALFLVVKNATAYTKKSLNIASQYVDSGGFQVGRGSTLSYRAETAFIPASTLKILTALVALETIGPDFRFTTRLYLDKKNNLYIQGGGDPLLTSEVVLEICQRLKLMVPDLYQVKTLFLDDSLYQLNGHQVSIENSDNPYDAPNGALAVNFNTIPIQISKNGVVSSGEQQTPTLPIMRRKAKLLQLGRGRHRINVAYKENRSRRNGLSPSLRYAGQLFIAQLEQCGVTVKGGIQAKKVPKVLLPELIYKSEKNLAITLKLLLAHSSNFIANQIFLQMSLYSNRKSGKPATWKQSQQIIQHYIKNRLKIPATSITVVEGSGLSLQNRINCRAMITILEGFKPWAHLLKKKDNIMKKSGSMQNTGIFCYAGYFAHGTKHHNTVINLPSTRLSPQITQKLTPFVLLLNQHRNSRHALLSALHQSFATQPFTVRTETQKSSLTDNTLDRAFLHIKKRHRWKRITQK